jgi:hypothetical protein
MFWLSKDPMSPLAAEPRNALSKAPRRIKHCPNRQYDDDDHCSPNRAINFRHFQNYINEPESPVTLLMP